MILTVIDILLLWGCKALAISKLSADGRTNTYDLINSVMAPQGNAIEAPDCGHKSFGPHITQIFDSILGLYVFRFHIHRDHDNDRCLKYDRQRIEIKIYQKSPSFLKGYQGEFVNYRWKFKLSVAFQPSYNFTHIHQIKVIGGPYASMPLFTLTIRKSKQSKQDFLEIRHSPEKKSTVIKQKLLRPFLDRWLSVTEQIRYAHEGYYSINISDVRTGETLFIFKDDVIGTWKEGAEVARPKWGIYRSLKDKKNLRDEIVDFTDFEIEK